MKHMEHTDKVFYFMGLFICCVLVAISIIENTGILSLTDVVYPCFFLHATGFYCPGCGGTHALREFVQGHIIHGFLYHPFVGYSIVGITIYCVWNTIVIVSKKYTLPVMHMRMIYIYIGLAIMFIQWIVKNVYMMSEGLPWLDLI